MKRVTLQDAIRDTSSANLVLLQHVVPYIWHLSGWKLNMDVNIKVKENVRLPNAITLFIPLTNQLLTCFHLPIYNRCHLWHLHKFSTLDQLWRPDLLYLSFVTLTDRLWTSYDLPARLTIRDIYDFDRSSLDLHWPSNLIIHVIYDLDTSTLDIFGPPG